MANWIYKDLGEDISEIISELSCHAVLNAEDIKSQIIPKAKEVAAVLCSIATTGGKKIFLVGDYDADGITASLIMSLIFDEMQIPYRVHIPRRFSEGYGISDKILSYMEDEDVVMTVDNGIGAKDVLANLKKETDVIIIDHHQAPDDGRLPDATILFNPEVEKNIDFIHYCGAGLCYKIAEVLQGCGHISSDTFEKITMLACIGTVADIMPLVEENRLIVKNGLKLMQSKKWEALTGKLDLPPVLHSSDIGFKIGPVFNATGRLFDDGGQKVYTTLYRTLTSNRNGVSRLVDNNDTRKKMQETLAEKMDEIYNAQKEMYPNFILIPRCPEGLVGILAGKLAEKTQKASFVVTETSEGVYKGSARADSEMNIKQFMDENKEFFIKYGGHKGAGGFSMTKESFNKMVKKCQMSTHKSKEIAYEYHLDVFPEDIPELLNKQEKLEPFGEGMPKPVIRTLIEVKNFQYMKDGKMVKFQTRLSNGKFLDVLGFDHGKWFKDNHEPRIIEVIGTLAYNYFAGKTIPQIEAVDMKLF